MRNALILVLPLMLLFVGCSHVISEQSRARADPTISFAALREDPDAYRGKFVILGGGIRGVTRAGEGTELEVADYALNVLEMPSDTAGSGGLFLAVTSVALDQNLYKPGVLVSLAGEVVGKKVRLRQGVEYTYPVIAVRELHIVESPPKLSDPYWGTSGGY